MNKKNYDIEFTILVSIIDEVMGVSKETLLSKTRLRPIVELRMIFSNVLKENIKKLSVEKIGELMNVDHSTVTYHIKTHLALMSQKDEQYKIKYERINDLYKNRILFTSDYLKDTLLNKKKKLEQELVNINDMLKTVEEKEKEANKYAI